MKLFTKSILATATFSAMVMAVGTAQAGTTGSVHLAVGSMAAHEAPVIHVRGGTIGTRNTLARKLEDRLRARAIREGRDPDRIWVNPERVPFNISGAYAENLYYRFYPEARKH